MTQTNESASSQMLTVKDTVVGGNEINTISQQQIVPTEFISSPPNEMRPMSVGENERPQAKRLASLMNIELKNIEKKVLNLSKVVVNEQSDHKLAKN